MLLLPLQLDQLFETVVVHAEIVSSYTFLKFLPHLAFSISRLTGCLLVYTYKFSSSFGFLHLHSLRGHGIEPTTALGGSSSFVLNGSLSPS
jgi:hypothetical protein